MEAEVAAAATAVTSLQPGGEGSNVAAAAAGHLEGPAASAVAPMCVAWPTDQPCPAEADEDKPRSPPLRGLLSACAGEEGLRAAGRRAL